MHGPVSYSTWTNTIVVFTNIITIVLSHDHSYRGTVNSGQGHHHSQGNVKQMQHGAPHERPTGFHDPKVVQDQEHIKEHLEGVADMGDKDLSQEELEFHYFKLHDFDNNTKLDGLEIYKALTHLLPFDAIQDETVKIETKGKNLQQIKEEQSKAEQKYYTDIVDQVLREDDIDGDGYLTYLEYVLARRREEHRQQTQHDKTAL